MSVDERTLVADVKSYIDQLGDFRGEVEQHSGKAMRMDLTIYYKNRLICTVEFKRPTTIEGKTPRNINVVNDALLKASHENPPPRYFMTSNFNETILWDNYDINKPLMARDVYTVYLDRKIRKDVDFEDDDVRKDIKTKMQDLALYIKDLDTGVKKAYYKPIGESFLLGLNAHLESAAAIVKNHVPNKILQGWWKDQGYPPKIGFDDSDREKIAKYSLYVLANKIVFYYVLRRMFTTIKEIYTGKRNIADLKAEFDSCFDNAKKVSGDYETVFENTEADLIPFENEDNLDSIKALINFLDSYDFNKLPRDLLGNIYDRLISPDERHANGQYYTPIPVVDLINALTIKNKNARVMDPACGSGTFLSRAFDLKLKLHGRDHEATRETVMEDIFGSDIAPYPAHLATIALASKLLMHNPETYPNVLRKDFLDIETSNIIPKLRTEFEEKIKNETRSLDGESKVVSFKPIDAFVGNLPYIRQEQIQNKEDERTKVGNFLKKNGFTNNIRKDEEYLYIPDKGADFHIYFWYYILPFLQEGSMVGFLTSDTWMNVEYGDGFKKFLNRYFKIRYIIDSSIERWFEDALVNTVITVLERTNNEEARKNNEIKFVRINRKISEIIENIDDAIRIADAIEKNKDIDGITIVRSVRQGDLDLNDSMKSKLFPYLRGPDEFFEIVNNKNMVSLDTIMNVNRGFTTGANEFFYVMDVTDGYSDEDLKKNFGLRGGEKNRIRIIKDGIGAVHLIEAEYLKPILKSPKEFTLPGKLVFNDPTKKYVVLIEETERSKIKKHALEYIEYGERNPAGEPYSERPTCKGRSPWWKLSPIIYPDIVFPKLFSSTFIYPKSNYLLDAGVYFGKIKNEYRDDLLTIYAFINSSLSFMYQDLYGRNYGGGGAPVEFKVYEANDLPVPNPKIIKPYYQRLENILERMEKRKIGSVFEEIWDMKGNFSLNSVKQDRLELDRTILKALGLKDPDKFLKAYYPSVVSIVKGRLDKAVSVKTTSKKDKISLSKAADDIILRIDVKDFPQDYVNKTIGTIKIRKGSKVSQGRDLVGHYISIDGKKDYYNTPEMAKYVYYCALRGLDSTPVPKDPKKVLKEFEQDLDTWRKSIEKEINSITDDDKYREKLFALCVRKLNYSVLGL